MKVHCPCGEVMRDQTDFLPHKAHLRPDQDSERFFKAVETLLDRQVVNQGEAVQERRDVLEALWVNAMRCLYQGPGCGRLHLDSPDRRTGYSFAPAEEETPRDLLWRTNT